jgi:hypothetical protein
MTNPDDESGMQERGIRAQQKEGDMDKIYSIDQPKGCELWYLWRGPVGEETSTLLKTGYLRDCTELLLRLEAGPEINLVEYANTLLCGPKKEGRNATS